MNTKLALINTTCGTAVANPAFLSHLDCPLGDSFTLCGTGGMKFRYLVVTPEQAESFARVVKHQGKENLLGVSLDGFCGDYYLALTFKHIMIGIEPDGYAHS